MPNIVLLGAAAVLLWSLVARRFERWGLAGPVLLVVLGAVVVFVDPASFAATIDSHSAEKVVELILAVLLFADATEVRGGVFGGEGRVIARLVLLALPLSLVLAVVIGSLLLPGTGVLVVVVMACVVMPTDFAPAAVLLRHAKVPERLRRILNVESGYNDGLVSPVFAMSLALAIVLPRLLEDLRLGGGTVSTDTDPKLIEPLTQFFGAFVSAVPATLVAILIGGVIGALLGGLLRWEPARRWAGAAGIRFAMVLAPLVVFGVATLPAVGANGFVAAFAAGLVYRATRTLRQPEHALDHSELALLGDVGVITSHFIWFVLGGSTVLVALAGADWHLIVFAALALTVLRMLPVYLALLRSGIPPGGRLLVGALGPRGTASIVFGLLAYNELPTESLGIQVLGVMVYTVIGSILVHGVLAPLLLTRFGHDPTHNPTVSRAL